jgi:putative ABC transport system permease protein
LLIGSLGLGVVVLINIMDRRQELAMMRAVGFTREKLKRIVLCEHISLLTAGIVCGVFSAIIAVLPAVKSPSAEIPYTSLTITIAAILLSGLAWIWIATSLALSGRLIDALRKE